MTKKPIGPGKGTGGLGNVGGMGTGGDTFPARWKSRKGHYDVALVQNYTRLTQKEMSFKHDYIKGIIMDYEGVPKDLIRLELQSTKQVTIFIDEVYYVHVGIYIIGKVSVRVMQVPERPADLTIVYREKVIGRKGVRNKKPWGAKSKGQKRSATRQRNREAGKGRGI